MTTEPFFASLPEGAMPTAFVGIIHFVMPNGSMARALSTGGEVENSTLVGLLEQVKYDLLREADSGNENEGS